MKSSSFILLLMLLSISYSQIPLAPPSSISVGRQSCGAATFNASPYPTFQITYVISFGNLPNVALGLVGINSVFNGPLFRYYSKLKLFFKC